MTLNRLHVNDITNFIKLLTLMALRKFWLMIAYTKSSVGANNFVLLVLDDIFLIVI